MILLRVVAIVSNVLFISYGIVGGHGPRFVLLVTMLPLDIHRLLAMRRLIRRVEEAVRTQSFNANWLQPYMKPELFRAGDIIFCTGDIADGGLLFGEIAMFTTSGPCTLSGVCETDAETLFITDDELRQLHFQNPQFGFQLVRLIVGRLVGRIDALEWERRRRTALETATPHRYCRAR